MANTKTSLTNQSYTSYMLDEAHKGGVLEILVAVLSCAWSYQMIGEHHKTIPGALEHPMYGEWVNGYSCQEYCESTQLIIDLVNKYGKGITKERTAFGAGITFNVNSVMIPRVPSEPTIKLTKA